MREVFVLMIFNGIREKNPLRARMKREEDRKKGKKNISSKSDIASKYKGQRM